MRITLVKSIRKDQGNCGKCRDPLPKGSNYRYSTPPALNEVELPPLHSLHFTA